MTDAQLSCLHYKLQSGQTPFIDMGVWGPHGDRIARAMRFVSQQWRDGQWKAVELPGATNLDAWEESWRIFWTGALMLQMATAATLDRYAAEFRARVLQHPDVWHLAAQADIRCRTEFWSQEKRKQEAFHSTHPSLSAYNPAQPWNSVLRASASHTEFWSREFEKPAMLYTLHSAKSVPARPPGPSGGEGLRNPWQSVNKLPHWTAVGRLVWRTLQASLGQLEELNKLATWVGMEQEWGHVELGQNKNQPSFWL